jgi:lambda family phage tail tape measure protein
VANLKTEILRIIADVKGERQIKKLANQMGSLNKNTKSMAGSFKFLRNASIAWFGAMRLGEIVRMSDTMQQLGDRIEVLSGGTADAGETFTKLRSVAKDTQSSLELTAKTYTRLAAAIGGAGIETDFLINLTKVLQDSFLVAGASLKETEATIVQLAQAFASGEVRGQELRSVMEQNAVVAKLLREEYGKDIYKKAATGAIGASDVLKILFDNQEKLAKQAKDIKPTIEKTIVAALDGIRESIFKLNDEWGISSKFAKSLEWLIGKFTLFAFLIGTGAVVALAAMSSTILTTAIPAVISFGETLLLITLLNPWATLATGLLVFTAVAIKNLDTLEAKFKRFEAFMSDLQISLFKFQKLLISPFDKNKDKVGKRLDDSIAKNIERSKKLRKEADKLEKGDKGGFKGLSKDKLQSQLDLLKSRYGANAEKLSGAVSLLNLAFKEGSFSARDYFSELGKAKLADLNQQFYDGKITLDAYNKSLTDIKKISVQQAFNQGAISATQFKEVLDSLKLEDMKIQLDAGKISLQEYNKELTKTFEALDFSTYSTVFKSGAETFLSNLKTMGEGVAETFSKAFGSLENELFDMVKTGKFEFNRFAQSILDDLLKIIIRLQIIAPLARAITGGSGGLSLTPGADPTLSAANGAAFNQGGIRAFASGGVVSSPTLFNYGSKTGLMGEAGPEAILPLSRSNGKLGVEASVNPVNINIINNSDTEITTAETFGSNGERNIEVVIESKVREGLSKGTYDKQLRSNFGISRKGY